MAIHGIKSCLKLLHQFHFRVWRVTIPAYDDANNFEYFLFKYYVILTNKIRSFFDFKIPSILEAASPLFISCFTILLWHDFLLDPQNFISWIRTSMIYDPVPCRRPISRCAPACRKGARAAGALGAGCLYTQLRGGPQGPREFILHDGPPYATGNIHIGHALTRSSRERGDAQPVRCSASIPNTCRLGLPRLPIEWKMRGEALPPPRNKPKPDFVQSGGVVEFARSAVPIAQKWIEVQRAEFKRSALRRLGQSLHHDEFRRPRRRSARELMKFRPRHFGIAGSKPVMGWFELVEKTRWQKRRWSTRLHQRYGVGEVSGTAAEAPSMGGEGPWRGAEDKVSFLLTASVVIWTTHSLDASGNRAISFSPINFIRPVWSYKISRRELAKSAKNLSWPLLARRCL